MISSIELVGAKPLLLRMTGGLSRDDGSPASIKNRMHMNGEVTLSNVHQ